MTRASTRFWTRSTVISILVIVAIGCFGLTMSIRQSTQKANDCHEAGGRIVDLGKDWICIDEEGRVIVP